MAVKKEKPIAKTTQFTIFQKGAEFKGLLEFKKPLKICGKFEGEINGQSLLFIEKGAHIKAHINTHHLIVQGEIVGNIIAKEKVELLEGASVTGNIRTPNLEIEDGVVFEGQCEMKKHPAKPPQPQTA